MSDVVKTERPSRFHLHVAFVVKLGCLLRHPADTLRPSRFHSSSPIDSQGITEEEKIYGSISSVTISPKVKEKFVYDTEILRLDCFPVKMESLKF